MNLILSYKFSTSRFVWSLTRDSCVFFCFLSLVIITIIREKLQNETLKSRVRPIFDTHSYFLFHYSNKPEVKKRKWNMMKGSVLLFYISFFFPRFPLLLLKNFTLNSFLLLVLKRTAAKNSACIESHVPFVFKYLIWWDYPKIHSSNSKYDNNQISIRSNNRPENCSPMM